MRTVPFTQISVRGHGDCISDAAEQAVVSRDIESSAGPSEEGNAQYRVSNSVAGVR